MSLRSRSASRHSSRRSPLVRRLAITAAAGALATAAAVTPAAAGDEWGDDPGTSSYRGDSGDPGYDEGRGGRDQGRDQGRYRGVVTADRLALRSAPNRGSEVIRYVHRGQKVSIYCKTGGESVQRNPIWYLLTDGTWAWGAARYIDNVGPAPRWC
ncbi:SH3 domain-containing protein [Streptomyces sp. NPDC090994]|uniref:SH3 domain-containing protein n=1 Tax=Streptomyces sp. NPDC090994 TaxID=3365969 RepID=UPI00382D52A4